MRSIELMSSLVSGDDHVGNEQSRGQLGQVAWLRRAATGLTPPFGRIGRRSTEGIARIGGGNTSAKWEHSPSGTDESDLFVEVVVFSCLSGVGVAQIKALGIQELLDGGQLIDLFPDWPDERFPLYALYPSRHLPAAKVRAFIDFVMAAIGPKAGRPL